MDKPMQDQEKTKKELILELISLRSKVAQLEKSKEEKTTAAVMFTRSGEEDYQWLFDTDAIGTFSFSAEGKVIRANSAFAGMFGYESPEDVIATVKNTAVDLYADPQRQSEIVQRMIENPDIKSFENIYRRRDGSTFTGDLYLWLVSDADGCPRTLKGFILDVTNRKLFEEKLKAAEETYRNIFMNAQIGLFRTDVATGIMHEANDSLAHFVGYKNREELLSGNFNIAERYVDAEARQKLIALIKEHGRCENFEVQFRRNDGSVIWIRLSARLLSDKGWLEGVSEDITDRKQAQEALKKSEELYTKLIATMPDIIVRMNLDGEIEFVNDVGLSLSGYQREELIGRNMLSFIAPEDQDRAAQNTFLMFEKVLGPKEYHLVMKDGRKLLFEVNGDVLRHEDKTPYGIVQICRNIDERRQAQQALRESEEKFRVLAASTPTAVMLYQDDRWIYANRAAENICGYSEKELLAMNFWEIVHPEFKSVIQKEGRKRQLGEETINRHEFKIIAKDGTEKWVDLSGASTTMGGRLAGIVSILDITERKRAEAEKRSLEERLRRAEKMEALGQMAGGVAHDLNNVLGILSGYSELLLMELPEGQRSRDHAEKILKSTQKGAAIIQDLLDLARRGVTVSDVVNLNSIVSGFFNTPVFEALQDYHPGVSFRTECQDELLNIKGSPVHLEKMLMNLVSNAAESISGRGKVTIRTENRYCDKATKGYDEVKEGDYAVLSVSDTGTGIPVEHLDKIFEPFYTKKVMGRSGTGLGLSIVWGTVKDHHGYIDVKTKVGEGSTFTLYFPVTQEQLTAPRAKESFEQYMGSGESVLVVDDVAEQRDIASRLIKRLGYHVHAVPSGEEAVEYLRDNQAAILVLDMIMDPGIDGLETYRRVLRINPEQKAILVSGFSETARVREAQKIGAGAYVRKPYLMEKIGMAIRAELNR
jgi:PAS domain S-box-containing protein